MNKIKILKNILDNKKIDYIHTGTLGININNYKIETSDFSITIYNNEDFYLSIRNIKNIIIDDNKIIVKYDFENLEVEIQLK